MVGTTTTLECAVSMNLGLLLTWQQDPILEASFDRSGQNGEGSARKRPKARAARKPRPCCSWKVMATRTSTGETGQDAPAQGKGRFNQLISLPTPRFLPMMSLLASLNRYLGKIKLQAESEPWPRRWIQLSESRVWGIFEKGKLRFPTNGWQRKTCVRSEHGAIALQGEEGLGQAPGDTDISGGSRRMKRLQRRRKAAYELRGQQRDILHGMKRWDTGPIRSKITGTG